MKRRADRFRGSLRCLMLILCFAESHMIGITACHATDSTSLGPDMIAGYVYIPPGTFTMGSPSTESDRFGDETPHLVTLTRGFRMKQTEVTQAEWLAVMGKNPSTFKGPSRPVEEVSWIQCLEFCNKLSVRHGLTPCYDGSAWNRSANGYRLPTEAEWEYACRAGGSGRFCSGDSEADLSRHGWYAANSNDQAHDGKLKEPNAWGLYDMHGNVWEWCWDFWGDYPSEGVTDPAGPQYGSVRVNRGGGWPDAARLCRSADRDSASPHYHSGNLGFRIVRNAD